MLWPTEKLFIGYAVIMISLLALAARQSPQPALILLFGHVTAIVLMVLLARWPVPLAQFARHWYLLLYVPFCYKQVPFLVNALHLRPADALLARWDQAMWKVDPVFWLSSMQNSFVTELLQLVYTMFIPGTVLLGLILWWRRPRPEFRYGTFLIALTFLLSYLGYLVLPARGPRFMAYASQHPALHGLWTFQSLQNLLDSLEGAQFDCFPSGHVAVVLVGCWIARRISPLVFYGFSVFATLITVSTVYLRYHYVIDVIAGILLAIVVLAASPAIYRKSGGARHPAETPVPDGHLDSSGTNPADALRMENEKLERLSANPPEEIFIVSDFHLGQGRNLKTGRFSRTENFLSDEVFSRFLFYCKAHEKKLLIINGDTFDFVRLWSVPAKAGEFEEWKSFLALIGVVKSVSELQHSISRQEKRYGLQTDDYKSAWKLMQMAKGHRQFFQALAGWLNSGASLLLTKGNHDLELYWPVVRRAFLSLLQKHGARHDAFDRVFYCDDSLVIGNVYLEHGHKYDPQQAIVGYSTLPDLPSQLNLPVGIFVNRYLVNRVEELEPFLGAIRPPDRILWIVLRRHPLAVISNLFGSLKFIRRSLKMQQAHNVFWYFIYSASVLLPFVVALLIGTSVFYLRHKSSVSAAKIYSLFGVGAIAPYLVAALREAWKWLTRFWDLTQELGERLAKRLGRKRQQVGEDAPAEGVYRSMQRIKFPPTTHVYAVMGHTHDQDVQSLPPLNGSAVLYLNTGAWIPVWPDNRPDLDGQVLYPFVHFRRIAPQQYVHQYLEWRDDRGAPAESYILEPPCS